MKRKSSPVKPQPKVAKKPLKPTEKTDAPIEAKVSSLTGEMLTLNYYLRLCLQSLLEDMRYNSLSPETVEALVLESSEMVNLSMSISALLKIWMNISRGLEMTTDDQLNLMRLSLGEQVVLDHAVYHFD